MISLELLNHHFSGISRPPHGIVIITYSDGVRTILSFLGDLNAFFTGGYKNIHMDSGYEVLLDSVIIPTTNYPKVLGEKVLKALAGST